MPALLLLDRWRKAFVLMALSEGFRPEKCLLKEPRKGIVLKKKVVNLFDEEIVT
jgi:hypothetical protein